MAYVSGAGSCIESSANNSAEDKNVTGESMSHHHNTVIALYISPLLRVPLTVAIIFFVCIILNAIYIAKRRNSVRLQAIEFFFVRNLLITDIIAVAVRSSFVWFIAFSAVVAKSFKGVPCTIVSLSYIPYCVNSLSVILVCFDRMLFITDQQRYVRMMRDKKIRYGIICSTWVFGILGIIPIFLDPELRTATITGVCKHRPFSNSFGIVFLLLPSALSASLQ